MVVFKELYIWYISCGRLDTTEVLVQCFEDTDVPLQYIPQGWSVHISYA